MQRKLNFSLTQLEYVLSLHKHGHFAKAAEACFVTQPTLSMQIQKLEESLNIVIFDRSKKPILLTETGRKLVIQMQNIVDEAKKIDEILHIEDARALEGEIHMGIIPTITPYLLPRLLPVIRRDFPGILLKVKELQTHKITEALEDDSIDVGLLAIPLRISKIFEIKLYWEPFHLLCRKDHELSAKSRIKHSQLNHDDLWLLEEGHCLRHQVLDICSTRKNSKRSVEFESGNLETLKNLVDSFGGYTLVPELAAEHLGRHSKLIPFERPIPAREVGLVLRREHHKFHLIEALKKAILNSLPDPIRTYKGKDFEILPV